VKTLKFKFAQSPCTYPVAYEGKIVEVGKDPVALPDFMQVATAGSSGELTMASQDENDAGDYTVEITATLANIRQNRPQRKTDVSPPQYLYDPDSLDLLPPDLIWKQTHSVTVKVRTKDDRLSYNTVANGAPYFVAAPVDIVVVGGQALNGYSFGEIKDPDFDEVEMAVDLGQARMFTWLDVGGRAAGKDGEWDGGSLRIQEGSTNCDWGMCRSYPVTVTLTDKPAGDRGDIEAKSKVYNFNLRIIEQEEEKPDPTAIGSTPADELEIVDSTGETVPNPPTIVTADGTEIPRAELTNDEIAAIEVEVEQKEEE
jgi:hypothetical protein